MNCAYRAPKTTYKFSGLDSVAQQKAMEALWDINVEHDWWDYVYEDAARVADILGIDLDQKAVRLMGGGTRYDPEIWFTGIDGNGGCSYRATYRYAHGSQRKIRAYAGDAELHRIADALFEAQRLCFFSITASVVPACRESCISVEVERGDGKELPEGVADSITGALQDFNHWIFSSLRAEHDYLTSEEAIRDSIEANDHDFDEDGNMV